MMPAGAALLGLRKPTTATVNLPKHWMRSRRPIAVNARISPFFLPAEFQSLQAPLQGIPEPATWGLMILGLWQGRCEPSRFAATPRDCNRSPTRLSRASARV